MSPPLVICKYIYYNINLVNTLCKSSKEKRYAGRCSVPARFYDIFGANEAIIIVRASSAPRYDLEFAMRSASGQGLTGNCYAFEVYPKK